MKLEKLTVKPGDTLWKIAETHLGAGSRYSELLLPASSLERSEPRKVGSDYVYPGDTVYVQVDDDFQPSGL